MAYSSQPRNQLEDRASQDDKVSGRIWKTVETETRKSRMTKAEKERSKEGSREKVRGKRSREKTEEEKIKDDRCKEDSKRIGNLG